MIKAQEVGEIIPFPVCIVPFPRFKTSFKLCGTRFNIFEAFIRKGNGEIWDLVQLSHPNRKYKPPIGWKEMDFNEENSEEMQKRMGYLLLDGNFDEEQLEQGIQKLLVKEDTEGIENIVGKIGNYEEFSYIEKIDFEWMEIPSGWEEVELTEQILADISINNTVLEDILGGRKKLIGKCPS